MPAGETRAYMTRIRLLCCGSVLATLLGCSTAALSTRGSAVRVVSEAEGECSEVGTVTGKGGGYGGEWVPNDELVEYATNDARNKAAELGANVVQLDPPQLGSDKGTTTSAIRTGVAFRCR